VRDIVLKSGVLDRLDAGDVVIGDEEFESIEDLVMFR
jgi:hypothetical protein